LVQDQDLDLDQEFDVDLDQDQELESGILLALLMNFIMPPQGNPTFMEWVIDLLFFT